MTYRYTARAYVKAATTDENWSRQAVLLDSITRGIPEYIATGYEPTRTARKYIEHVESLAAELREALTEASQVGRADDPDLALMESAERVNHAAHALLAAIGEGER